MRIALQAKSAWFILLAVTSILMVALFAGQWTRTVSAQAGFSKYVDDSGAIAFPAGFRKDMAHLGSWFVPTGEASGFHDVFVSRSAAETFKAEGGFPDGAVIVKELRAARSGDYTTGQGVSHATVEVKQWFVMVKDAKGRFAGNPLWGDGWGWALFRPDAPENNIAKDYRKDCLGCHVPAKATDWIYVEGYPGLRHKM